jgi:rhodanese-related sulfurtransferase
VPRAGGDSARLAGAVVASDTLGGMTMTATSITAADLDELLRAEPDTLVIDVRTPAEYESHHVPGTVNVPLTDLASHAERIARLDKPAILLCASGVRAGEAERALARHGKTNLRVLEGGIGAWERQGANVRRGKQVWALERQVRLVAGSIVLTSVLASTAAPKAKWVAGAIGAGLTFAALSNSCAMGMALLKMPWNKPAECDVTGNIERLFEAS